jgi:cyclic pyranopterin phosphate synthase
VHINLGPVCNNNCLFCMEEDRQLRYEVNSAITPPRVRTILEGNAGAEEVCFTSGEPTLVKELPSYCTWARALGYSRVSVMTNGRRLSHMPYTAGLVRSGMTHFYVSIHGHEARLHDSLVRTPGAFAQTVAGIDNLARLKAWGVTVHTSTVITKRNLPHLGSIYRFLRGHGVDQVVLNVMQATGRADTHFEQIFPSYTEIAAEMRRLIETCGEPEPEAYLVDIPLCTTEGIPDRNRGFVERYVHYEVADGRDAPSDEAAARARRSADGQFLEVERADLDAVEREKRPECRTCTYDAVCEGVWKRYVSRYGWDEMVPVPSGVTGSDRSDPGTL